MNEYVINIDSQSKSSKDLWNAVNTVTGKNVTSDLTLSELNCSEMNNYFAIVGKKLRIPDKQLNWIGPASIYDYSFVVIEADFVYKAGFMV